MSDSPYKLFDYYTYEDRHLFFGREEESLRMVGEILSTRLLVLFAPSGSGKSSLINAGVRPLLEDRGFRTVYVRMETDPATSIRQSLGAGQTSLGAGLPTPPEPPTEGLPESGKPTVAGVARSETGHGASETPTPPSYAQPRPPPDEFLRQALQPKDANEAVRPLVIFLDQFEEFFTVYRDQPQMRQDFIRELAAIRYDTSLPVYFVLSLRDDYFVNLNEFREAIPSIFQNNANIQLRPLDDAAAEQAIVNPASAAGCEFEEGLPQRIIDDLKPLNPDGNGVLPITLQIVCHNLWLAKDADEHRLTAVHYDQLAGARKIIDQQLDRSLAQIPGRYHRLMRRLFRVLMTADLTKRLRSADDLAQILRLGNAGILGHLLNIGNRFVSVLPIHSLEKLESLLIKLTEVNILRVEHRQGASWYEFRHDYLAKRVASWVRLAEERVARRRWITGLISAVALPGLVWIGTAINDFRTYIVSLEMNAESGFRSEAVITRKWNPCGFHLGTGLYWDVDLTDAGFARLNGPFELPSGDVVDWDELDGLLQDGTFGEIRGSAAT